MSVAEKATTAYSLKCDCGIIFPPSAIVAIYKDTPSLWTHAMRQGWTKECCPDCAAKNKTFIIHEADIGAIRTQRTHLDDILRRDVVQISLAQRNTLRDIRGMLDIWLEPEYRITPEQKDSIDRLLK